MTVGTNGGRLTLVSGDPTGEAASQTTLYYTPFVSDLVDLYTGSVWSVIQFTERSISIPATSNTVYDVFLYNSSGTATLELTAWASATVRATDIAFQNGIYVKSGSPTRRYLGTICTDPTSGQCSDSDSRRFLWNYYHRQRKRMYYGDTTNHTYATGAFRYWNNDSTAKVDWVCGVGDNTHFVSVTTYTQNVPDTDGRLTFCLDVGNNWYGIACGRGQRNGAAYAFNVPQGKHFWALVEYGLASTSFVYGYLSVQYWG